LPKPYSFAMAGVEPRHAYGSTLLDACHDLFLGLGMPCLEIADVASVASASKVYLQIAVHDIHWKPRLMHRRWDLAPGGLSGSASVKLWQKFHDLEPSLLSNSDLCDALGSRGISKRSIKDKYGPEGFRKDNLQRVLADALQYDLPVRLQDGDGWWRQLYRALVWGEVLRRGEMAQNPAQSEGHVERLFVGEHADWGHGWDTRYLFLDGQNASLAIYAEDAESLLAHVALAGCPTLIGELHGQPIVALEHRMALRWPEDVTSTNGSPLEAWHAVSRNDAGQHSWSFTVSGLGVDVLLRVASEAQREAWVEGINTAASRARGQVRLGSGTLAGLDAVQSGGAEWQRVGMRETDPLQGLTSCLGIEGRQHEQIS